ncbi:SDR family NAD(P)-dependent oxidoreductase [Actinokineospora inagensis]|uniref:SDR family NAD(P)-dependent oxidoreductase n=1 Tax=Actinokineospora inagensis TaxID=103730 RepID=UPI000421606F|nr:SDR family oxidoreductase [Actinokineospora inagensis]
MSTALITGASAGLGEEFAGQLAARGYDVVLVARNKDRLAALAARLRAAHGVRAEVIVQDLSEVDAVPAIVRGLDALGMSVHTLVNNAGFGTAGRFEEIADGRDRDQLMVNVVSLVALSRALVPQVLANRGAIVNVASTAALQPTPYFAAYGAGKTFVLNFSLALRAELKGRATVLCVCPGPTETRFFDEVEVGRKAAIGSRFMTAEAVVTATLRALDRDRGYVVPGFLNYANAHLSPRRPRKVVTAISERITRSALSVQPSRVA